MKKQLIFIILCIYSLTASGQITKGNWMVGGNARFGKQQQQLSGNDISSLMIQVSPNLGYFLADKFAVGLKPSFGYTRINNYGNYISKSTTFSIGPLVRYYFLPVDNRLNILAESSYQYLSDFKGYSQNTFIFSAGPVIYFNSSVGIEFTLNYESIRASGSTTSTKTLFLGVGFQIHLEKEKNH
ncbi:MAG: hypothetical protein LC134_08095 [Chitinophagales bacterium]|nr:hypothetical protein [Chitinophagales bacterium]